MPLPETLLGILSAATGVHGWISGLRLGSEVARIRSLVQENRDRIIALGEGVYYAPSVQDIGGAELTGDVPQLRQALAPIHGATRSELLATALVSAPPVLRDRRPEDLLFGVEPLTPSVHAHESSVVPVVFTEGNKSYVGWQKAALIPDMLGVSFAPTSSAGGAFCAGCGGLLSIRCVGCRGLGKRRDRYLRRRGIAAVLAGRYGDCLACGGSGELVCPCCCGEIPYRPASQVVCPVCRTDGTVPCRDCVGDIHGGYSESNCERCRGTGRQVCIACLGRRQGDPRLLFFNCFGTSVRRMSGDWIWGSLNVLFPLVPVVARESARSWAIAELAAEGDLGGGLGELWIRWMENPSGRCPEPSFGVDEPF